MSGPGALVAHAGPLEPVRLGHQAGLKGPARSNLDPDILQILAGGLCL
jgi:hypothetical protein